MPSGEDLFCGTVLNTIDMKANRFLSFIASVAALSFATTACDDDKKEDLGAPQITLNPSEITVEKAGATTTIELTATRDWTTNISDDDAKWISVLPTSGSASADPVKVEVKVLENSGFDRTGSVSFSIGFDSKTLTVNQAGTGKIEGVIGEIVAGEENKTVEVKDVLVTGVTTKSIVITDPTGSILVFANANPGAKVGDKVNVTGTTGKHNGFMQIASPTITVVSSGNVVTYPDPTTIDINNISSFSSSVISFVTFRGVPKKTTNNNNEYVNIYVGDYKDKDLSLSYYPGDLESLLDKEIDVKGWYVGGKDHYQVVATNVNGKDITSVDGGSDTPDVPGTKMTLAQMLTADRTAGTVVESEEVLVGALTTRGYVATDGTSSIYVFHDSTPTVKIGDKVTFKGTLIDYYGLPEITSPKTTTVSSDNKVTYPTAKDITATFDSYTANVAEYVTYTAKVVKNGNYTNFEVEGATKFKGALSSAPSSIYSTFAEGDKVQVTGYFNTLNTSANLLNVIATEVKVLEKGEGGGDNPGGDKPGEGEFSSNVSWTLVDAAYSDEATINGTKGVSVLKLGTGKKVGSATIVIPAGTKKISFYGLAWKGKTASVAAELGGTAIGNPIELTANPGCTSTSPYTINDVTTTSKKTIDIAALNGGNALPADVTITVKSVKGSDCRVILFGIQAEK